MLGGSLRARLSLIGIALAAALLAIAPGWDGALAALLCAAALGGAVIVDACVVRPLRRDLARRIEERTAELARTSAALEELRRTQEQLVVADRRISLGRLAAGVGHEINNPLAYVAANLAWVTDALGELRDATPGQAQRILDEVSRAVADAAQGTERIRQIVRQLRTFSGRAEDGPLEPVDLRQVMDAAVAMVAHEVRHRGQLFRVDASPPRVLANPIRLSQVFVNLLVNAAQALPEGAAERSEVRVTIGTAPDGRACAEVADTGCGIAPENLGRLFDPFFTTKPVGVGTGLGLSISDAIVRALGGEISVSSAPGRGSTFRVLLPALREDAAVAEPLRGTG